MSVRQLITRGTFGPRALATIGGAFDHAWQEVEGYFNGPLSRQAARLILANAILAEATDDSRDVRGLKWAGIQELIRRGYVRAAESPRHRTLMSIIESQNLIATSRTELKFLRASVRSAGESVEKTLTLLQTARPEADRISS